jgi:putative ABC transport system permease protein
MATIWQDTRYALRMFKSNPGFAAVAILTLALGIGANVSIFGVVDAVLLEPLPYPSPDRLVAVFDVQPQFGFAPASLPEFRDWQEHGHMFEELAAYFPSNVTLTSGGRPDRLAAVRTSAGLSSMLGINTALGRSFNHSDESPEAEPIALISYGLWQRRFGGEPGIVGRAIDLDGRGVTVIGVLEAGAERLLPGDVDSKQRRDIWLPLRLDPQRATRGNHFLRVAGRLRPQLGLEGAGREAESLAVRFQQQGTTLHGISIQDLRTALVGGARPGLLIVFCAVGFVLLIGCANVANLLLARASARQAEIAVRVALGAGRARLIRQLVTESLLLAGAGGILGLPAAWACLRWAAASGIEGMPRVEQLGIDSTVLIYTVGLSLLTAVLFGLAPAFKSTAYDISKSIREGGSIRLGTHRVKGLLVVSEVALSLVLLIGAGLTIRSFAGLMKVDLGFDPENIMTFNVNLPEARYPEAADRVAFFHQTLEHIAALAGVEAAAAVSELPVAGGTNGNFAVEGITWPDGDAPFAEKRRATKDYFSVMSIPLLRGRFFDQHDTIDSRQVAVVNQEFVRLHLGDTDPIGVNIDVRWFSEGTQEIVGVVGDVKHRGVGGEDLPAIYVPFSQFPASAMSVVVRSRIDPGGLAPALRDEVMAVDPSQPIWGTRTLDEVISADLIRYRLTTGLLTAFAGFALLMAMLGIYGVMSYAVVERTREIGIRMALGASTWEILRLVIGQGMTFATVGIGFGLAFAYALSRFLASLLFGVSTTDPTTFTCVVLILMVVALTACYLPARRAARSDPLVALRHE